MYPVVCGQDILTHGVKQMTNRLYLGYRGSTLVSPVIFAEIVFTFQQLEKKYLLTCATPGFIINIDHQNQFIEDDMAFLIACQLEFKHSGVVALIHLV